MIITYTRCAYCGCAVGHEGWHYAGCPIIIGFQPGGDKTGDPPPKPPVRSHSERPK